MNASQFKIVPGSPAGRKNGAAANRKSNVIPSDICRPNRPFRHDPFFWPFVFYVASQNDPPASSNMRIYKDIITGNNLRPSFRRRMASIVCNSAHGLLGNCIRKWFLHSSDDWSSECTHIQSEEVVLVCVVLVCELGVLFPKVALNPWRLEAGRKASFQSLISDSIMTAVLANSLGTLFVCTLHHCCCCNGWRFCQQVMADLWRHFFLRFSWRCY